MKRLSLLALLLSATLLLAACSEDGEAQSIACVNTDDCPVGLTCHNGYCIDPNDPNLDGDGLVDGDSWQGECRTSDDCDDGYVCIDAFCLPDSLIDGDTADGDAPDGDTSDGDTPDGDTPDGDTPDGDTPDGDTDGDTPDGDTPDGDEPGDPCKDHSDCNDGMFCNGTELCGENNRCVKGNPPCDDGVDCTDDLCDEENNQCRVEPNHAKCSDNNPCTGQEICDSVLGCQNGTPPICDDSIACTTDSCSPYEGCVFEPNNTACADDVDCTVDTCQPDMGGCVHTPDNAACDDGIACTSETCDTTDGCIIETDDTACDDGFSCTIDRCLTTGCDIAGDNTQCTAEEFCDPTADFSDQTTGCAPRPECAIDSDCDDARWCNGTETCVELRCVPGTPPVCDDSISCTQDACNEETDSCDNTPINSRCSDSNICNGREVCDRVLDCQPGEPLNCNDDVDCTEDRCDPETGCSNRPSDPLCNDGINCTVDLCNPVEGCKHQPDNSFCNDFVPCTVDACNAQTGCTFTPNDAYCDDGIDCTQETCTAQFNCRYVPQNSECDDSIACTGDICEIGVGCRHNANDAVCGEGEYCEAETGCVVRPVCATDSDCSDNDVCNGVEKCVSGQCYTNTPLNCDDEIACTVDSCNPQSGCVHTMDHQFCDDQDICTGDVCVADYGCYYEVVKDDDNDYYLDSACNGGTDCNDSNANINPGMNEVCDDAIDNNCDGLTDLQDPNCNCAGGCAAGRECCNGQCVDILLNNDHCGACNSFCAGACWQGECKPAGKCATALNNLITANRTLDSSTCSSTDQFNARNHCDGASLSSSGKDHVYAVKPIDGNSMRVYYYPDGFSSDEASMYVLEDCWNQDSCVDYTWATEENDVLYYTPSESNGGKIFFVVLDYRSGDCGSYSFKVDYDYEPSDCRHGGLIPLHGPAALLFALAFWSLFLFALWRRRRSE